MAVAVGASVAAVIIIILTLICLCMWRYRLDVSLSFKKLFKFLSFKLTYVLNLSYLIYLIFLLVDDGNAINKRQKSSEIFLLIALQLMVGVLCLLFHTQLEEEVFFQLTLTGQILTRPQ